MGGAFILIPIANEYKVEDGQVSQAQYDKSYGDLVKKMGMEEVAKEIAKKNLEQWNVPRRSLSLLLLRIHRYCWECQMQRY